MKSHMARFKFLSIVAIAALPVALAACSDGFTSADASNIDAVNQGRPLYAAHCASCHGDNLQGQADWRVPQEDGTLPAPPHDDSGHTWHHGDALLFNYTKNGGQSIAPEGFKSGMPAYGDQLTDSEIWAILSFIKSRWSLNAQIRQGRMNK